MKRVLIGLGIALIAGVVIALVSMPLVKRYVKHRIVAELKGFIREGRLEVEDVSVSPKRRQARLLGVRVYDRSGRPVVTIRKIDVTVRRIHQRHADASLRVFEPTIAVDAARFEELGRLIRYEAFREEGPVTVDRVDVEGGHLALMAEGILSAPETLAFVARGQFEDDSGPRIDAQAAGPLTKMALRVGWTVENGLYRFREVPVFEMTTSNMVLRPPAFSTPDSSPDTIDQNTFRLTVMPADTVSSSPADLGLTAGFAWGSLRGEFSRLFASADTPGLFTVDAMRFFLGRERLLCADNVLDVRTDDLRLRSGRWIREQTGLILQRVNLTAARRGSTLTADLDGHPIRAEAAWGSSARLRLDLDTMPLALLFREAGESLPLSGAASIRVEANEVETSPGDFSWKAQIASTDLRVGPAFGKISIRANIAMSGVGTSVEDLSGTVEPAPGVSVRIRGKGNPRGFSGRASLKDRPLTDIKLLGELFGREIPLIGESGRAGLDVDFSVNRNLQLFLRGRVRLEDAAVMSKGFPFLIEGLNVDIPFEYRPDTGKLILSEAASGRASAETLVVGPYRFDRFSVTTASKGDKILTDFSPIPAFGGTIRAKVLFHFSETPHQHTELSIDSVSLKQMLAPFSEARNTLTGLIHGEANLRTTDGDILTARGPLWVKVSAGPSEPMRVSRRFLERIGGAAIRKLDLPKQVPYKNGFMKVRVADGWIWFDEVSLEAQTLLRKIQIGKVVNPYKINDLIDVLRNVSTENVKVEFGGRKRK